jgi:hypothetical protein
MYECVLQNYQGVCIIMQFACNSVCVYVYVCDALWPLLAWFLTVGYHGVRGSNNMLSSTNSIDAALLFLVGTAAESLS